MKIHLLRHTKPEIEEGICYGQSDIGLSKNINTEFESVKHTITSIEFDVIYSSPLMRCMQLAEFLSYENIEIINDDRLKEMNFGNWEMMNWQDISKENEATEWFNDYVNVKCPKGESYIDLHKRAKAFLKTLKIQNRFKTPLIITHSGVIRAFYSIIESVSLKESFDLKVDFGELKTFQL